MNTQDTKNEDEYARLLDADDYPLRHLAKHLHEAGHTKRFYRLLTKNRAWMDVKFTRLSGDTEYLTDFEIALQDFNDPLTSQQLEIVTQLVIARAVLKARAKNILEEDLELLVFTGRVSLALNSVRMRSDENLYGRFDGFITIYKSLKAQGMIRIDILNEAIDAAQCIIDAGWRSISFGTLAILFMEINQTQKAKDIFSRAKSAASNESPTHDLPEQFAIVATNLAKAKQFKEALQEARAIEHVTFKSQALASIVRELVSVGNFNQAQKILSDIDDNYYLVSALISIAKYLFQYGDFKQGHSYLQEANRFYKAIKKPHRRIFILTDQIELLIEYKQIEQSKILINKLIEQLNFINSKSSQESLIGKIIHLTLKATSLQEAERLIASISHPVLRDQARLSAVFSMARLGNIEYAKKRMMEYKDTKVQQNIVAAIVESLVQSEQFDEAIDTAKLIQNSDSYLRALRKVALGLAKAGHLQKANAVFELIQHAKLQLSSSFDERLILTLVRSLTSVNYFTIAHELTTVMSDNYWRLHALCDLAVAMEKGGLGSIEVFTQANEVISRIDDNDLMGRKEKAIIKLIESYAKAGKFTKALLFAQTVEAEIKKTEALSLIAINMAQSDQIEDAKLITNNLEDVEKKLPILLEIAGSLFKAGLNDEAKKSCMMISNLTTRPSIVLSVANLLLENGEFDSAELLFKRVYDVGTPVESERERVSTLCKYALIMASFGRQETMTRAINDAKRVSLQIKGPWRKFRAFIELSETLGNLGYTDESKYIISLAQEVVTEITSVHDRETALMNLSGVMVKVGMVNSARQIAGSIPNQFERRFAFDQVRIALIKRGHFTKAFLFQGSEDIESLLRLVYDWGLFLSGNCPICTGSLWSEATRIASWSYQPEYKIIHQKLQVLQDKKSNNCLHQMEREL